ncbi:MAG: 50S ribosomal protein L10 [Candidatus Brocadiia bacterium]
MPRRVKELMVAELEERFRGIGESGCVLVDYQGASADSAATIRETVREKGCTMMVVKNSLFSIAVERLGAEPLKDLLQGPVAVVQAQDPVTAAKAVDEAREACETLQVRGGYADGKVLDAESVEKLAEIPGREELLSMIAGALLSPLRRLAGGLLDRPRAFLNGLDQLRERKEEQQQENE